MKKVYKYIMENTASGKIDKQAAVQMIKMLKQEEKEDIGDIAVIGLAARYPGADNAEEFWENIRNGVNSIGSFPETRKQDMDNFLKFKQKSEEEIKYIDAAYLNEIDKFDYKYFRLSPREASLMDPSQRLFLETVFEAIEDSGYGGKKLVGSKTGVYVGYSSDLREVYARLIAEADPSQLSLSIPGNLGCIIPSRISFFLDLKGPSMLIDTACSSSLISVHIACKAIKNGECDLAIAGGVRVNLLPLDNQVKIGIESSDGKTRAFDDSSDGTGTGEGVGAVVLKPLSKALKDRDNIYAVIKGSSINQDGSSAGITAPNVEAQTAVILSAWKEANIDPETISYIETHGTGTKLGDPIEIEGIQNGFKKYTDRKQFCAVSTVKTNIGHLYEGAGIAGLIKAIMALKHRELPPSLNFSRPNRRISFENSPVYVNTRLAKWESEGHLRKCGVSAFGFSGTNCHMVLEEAPPVEEQDDIPANGYQVLALSAKSEDALRELVKKYMSFLNKDTCLKLEDICYTANTGRGHYNYRLAFVIKNIENLRKMVNSLNLQSFEEKMGEGIYFGRHNIVISDKENRQHGEITESEKNELSLKAYDCIEEIASDHEKNSNILNDICALYTKGAEVEWELLYKNQARRIISIPTYPLERSRCWLDIKPQKVKQVQKPEKVIHPLLEHCAVNSMEEDIYTTEYSAGKHFILSDHRIMGRYVVPGTTYLEVAREVGRIYYPGYALEFRDILFVMPVILGEGETRTVQTIVKKNGDFLEFIVASKADQNGSGQEDTWERHAEGKVYKITGCMPVKYDIERLKAECSVEDKEINQNELTAGFIEFGPRWLNYHRLRMGKGVSLAELTLPSEFKGDLDTYYLHPSLMDMAVNSLILTLGKRYLPLSYKSTKVYSPAPARFYSYTRMKDIEIGNQETVSFDVELLDESGNVFASIEDYAVKKVYEFKKLLRKNLYSRISWTEEKLEHSGEHQALDSILVIRDNAKAGKEIVNHFKKSGIKVIEAEFGTQYSRSEENLYILRPDTADLGNLITKLKEDRISKILYLPGLSGGHDIGSIEELDKRIEAGVLGLFNLTRALAANNIREKLKILLVCDYVYSITGDEKIINSCGASLFGLGEVISKEHANLKVRCIDIEGNSDADNILAELYSDSSFVKAAYRNGSRYVETVEKLNIEEIPDDKADIKENGVYIITGGMGGIGLEICKYIASRAKANLVLINRTALPGRESWDGIIKSGGKGKLYGKISAIRSMEEIGSNVQLYSADVSDMEKMNEIIEEIRMKYGRINGVIHGAGVAGDGFIISKDEKTFKEVIRPKIYGAWILDKLTEEDKPDFFVMLSSVASILAFPGQSDYTAANSYMDSFAEFRSLRGGKTITINWPAWKDTGMAVDHGANFDTLLKAIATSEAIDCFDEVLNKKLNRVIAGEWTYNRDMLEQLNINLSHEIKIKLENMKNKIETGGSNSGASFEVVLKGKPDESYTETEKRVAQVWGEVLGFREIDIYENFYDLGGDSILAARLVNTINKRLESGIGITEVFNYLTIARFAEYMDKMTREDERVEDRYPAIQHGEKRKYYPISSEQKRLYLLYQFMPHGTHYNLPIVMEMEGELDKRRLEEVFNRLIKRHEMLRTSFEMLDGSPVQKVHDSWKFNIEYAESDESEIKSVIDEFIRPFDLSRAPLMRAKLVKLEDAKHVFMLDIHHIAADGTSIGILIRDFISLYKNISLPDIKVKYRDYSVWQSSMIDSGLFGSQEKYWIDLFSNEIPVLNMPTDFSRPSEQSFEGDVVEFTLESELTSKLKNISSKHNATLFMTLLAGYNVLLSKYTGQEDIVVGSPIAGRNHSDLENIMGMFVNILPMRNYPQGDKTFEQFLEEVKVSSLKAYENQSYRFEELVEKIGVRRDISRNPLFDTLFVLQNSNKDIEITNSGVPKMEMELEGLNIHTYQFEHKISKFDFTMEIIEREGRLRCCLEYCTKLFKRESIERLTVHFKNILEEISKGSAKKIYEIGMMTEAERSKVLYGFNSTKVPYCQYETLSSIFEQQARKTPDNIAVAYEGTELTYRELNEKSNQLAGLLNEKGIGPDRVVGLMVERSAEMLVGIISILKAGGAYLPIDPKYPEERVSYILEDSDAKVILTSSEYMDKVKFAGNVLDIKDSGNYKGGISNPDNKVKSDNLAYVIYTSGSTGKPKGVMIAQRSVINLVTGLNKHIYSKYQGYLNVALVAPYVFDASVQQIFAAVLQGHKLVIVPEDLRTDGSRLIKFYKKNMIDISDGTPTHIAMISLVEDSEKEYIPVKHFIIGGEAFPYKYALDFYKKFEETKPVITNVYGPTECCVDATAYEITYEGIMENPVIPIGIPMPNHRMYILGKGNELLPAGVAGELCIAGDGLARGYLNREELSREKFVPDPFEKGGRMYRTGDLARWLADGNIEFLGRIDHQVKIRGFRMELGEIESQLLNNEFVKEAVVAVREDSSGNKYLCAYLVAEKEMAVAELREHLSKQLPDYMIPSYFIQLEKMPLTHNGKVDRKALPQPEGNINTGAEYAAPTNDIEEKLVEVWQDVLGVEHIGIDDDFFALGGDSIKTLQISSRLKKYGLLLEVKDIFKHLTIRELSAYVKPLIRKIDQSTVEGEAELTPVQKWFFECKFNGMNHWNQAVMLYSSDGFDEEILRKVFTGLTEHHDALRMVYRTEEQHEVQINKGIEGTLFKLKVVGLKGVEGYEERIKQESESIQSSMDLYNGPLVRLGLFKTDVGDHLLIAIHHLIVDGISWRILLEDFAAGYMQARENRNIEFPDKTDSYRDWAGKLKEYAASNELLKEIEYWKQIQGNTVKLLPKDNEITGNYVCDSVNAQANLSEKETEQLLKQVNKAYNTEINDILLTALGIAVKKWSGLDSIAVSMEGHGREEISGDIDIKRTVGWFTAIYPVVLDMTKSNDLSYQIKSIKETLRRIPNKGIGYGILKYLTPHEMKEGLELDLKPEILFNYLGQFDNDIETPVFCMSKIKTGPAMSPKAQRQWILDINAMVVEGRFTLDFTYNKNQYSEESIYRLVDGYKESLQEIIAHCTEKEDTELTPSDVGNEELSIEELENITDFISNL